VSSVLIVSAHCCAERGGC